MTREAAETALAQVLRGEPDWVGEIEVVRVEFGRLLVTDFCGSERVRR